LSQLDIVLLIETCGSIALFKRIYNSIKPDNVQYYVGSKLFNLLERCRVTEELSKIVVCGSTLRLSSRADKFYDSLIIRMCVVTLIWLASP
jgi:hypothetical protein